MLNSIQTIDVNSQNAQLLELTPWKMSDGRAASHRGLLLILKNVLREYSSKV